MKNLATHHLIEFMNCDAEIIDSPKRVRAAIRELCRTAPLNAIKSFHHQFAPHGLTYVVLLKESHLAYHSWPEHRYAAVDLFLCGEVPNLKRALAEFGAALKADQGVRARVHRGPHKIPARRKRA